jgi:hypothetical protein
MHSAATKSLALDNRSPVGEIIEYGFSGLLVWFPDKAVLIYVAHW